MSTPYPHIRTDKPTMTRGEIIRKIVRMLPGSVSGAEIRPFVVDFVLFDVRVDGSAVVTVHLAREGTEVGVERLILEVASDLRLLGFLTAATHGSTLPRLAGIQSRTYLKVFVVPKLPARASIPHAGLAYRCQKPSGPALVRTREVHDATGGVGDTTGDPRRDVVPRQGRDRGVHVLGGQQRDHADTAVERHLQVRE